MSYAEEVAMRISLHEENLRSAKEEFSQFNKRADRQDQKQRKAFFDHIQDQHTDKVMAQLKRSAKRYR